MKEFKSFISYESCCHVVVGWQQAVASIVVEGMHNYVNAVEDNKYLKTAGSWKELRRATTTTQLTQSKRHHNHHYNPQVCSTSSTSSTCAEIIIIVMLLVDDDVITCYCYTPLGDRGR